MGRRKDIHKLILNETQPELLSETEINKLKGFGRFREATKKQKAFAGKLELDLEAVPQNAAEAMLEYLIKTEFHGEKKTAATQKQVEFGRKYNFDFSCMPPTVAYAYIRNILHELNFIIIEQHGLGPRVWTKNIHNDEIRQILSIDKYGMVRFSDMERPFRFARSLVRCIDPPDGKPIYAINPIAEQTEEQLLKKLINCIVQETNEAV